MNRPGRFVRAALHEHSWGRALRMLAGGRFEVARLLGRLLVCAYYLNLAAAEVETWHHLHTVEAQQRFLRWQEPGGATQLRELPFPYLFVALLTLAVALAATDVLVPWLGAGGLLAFTVWRDVRLTWAMITNIFKHGGGPTELLMKQLAMMGSALLLLACSISAAAPRQLRRVTAGLLRVDDPDPRGRRPGLTRSAALLLGRLLMAGLLVFAGYHQVLRVCERWSAGAAQPQQHHYGRPDARDNNWLLLECVLALPLALGVATGPVSLALCAALLCEAVMHWRWWGGGFPSWHLRQNTRNHFFTNTAVAGGLLLMQSVGSGLLSVDALLLAGKKD